MELCNLDNIDINKNALKTVSKELCEEYMIFPYDIMGESLYLVATEDLTKEKVKYISFLVRKNINLKLCSEGQIIKYINQYYEENYRQSLMNGLKDVSIKNTGKGIINAKGPIVFLVDSIIRDGVFKGASDIHIEPLKDNVRIRYRVDGVLIKVNTDIPKTIYENIATRIKVISGMDLGYKYYPQDGEANIEIHGELYDFRVSTLPTIHGEKFVLRILRRDSEFLKLENLGFRLKDYNMIRNILKVKQGLIIITGPTGSGKTSTLYSMIRSLNEECRNIITIEKPIECDIEGINQVSVGTKGNLKYSEILKASLRQDPDVIMIGEIIDRETAEIAIRASLTGHLVLTTLHTNDASSTINRLIDIGIPRELINSSLLMIIAQRLTRVICNKCKASYFVSASELGIFNNANSNILTFKGKGCSMCNNTGYIGRTIAYEIMTMNNKIKKAINSCDNDLIRETAIESGMITIDKHFESLVIEGITTIDEYYSNMQVYNMERVLGADYGV